MPGSAPDFETNLAGTIVIRPVEDATLTLEQRLAGFNPAKHGGKLMQSQAVGAEQW